ncbi:MAG: AbrB/MazE/SpoVT family DNA-binding domain-containing protein [Candidatus Dormibacteraceae bacterium]
MAISSTGFVTQLDPRGRLVLPAAIRKLLAVEAGDDILLNVQESGMVQMRSRAEVAHRWRGRLRAPKDRDLVAELLAERREEAARE